MRVYLDNIIFSLQKAGGISVYWFELTKRLFEHNKDCEFFELENQNIFRNKIILATKKESSLALTLLRYMPFLKKLPKQSIFHSSYYRVSLQKDVANITTVHDFTYEYYRKGLAKRIHVLQKRYALNHSDGIICVSENTKKDLIKYYPHIDESKIQVVHNGVGDEFFVLSNPQVILEKEFSQLCKQQYILYVGDRSNYKNFDIAVAVASQRKDLSLVVIGKDFTNNEKKTLSALDKRMHHFTGISSDKLNILYNNAFCLLYPSCYEGFGIPVAEAMKAGCPVVSTNCSSIPEVAGDAGLLVDKITVDDFIGEIKKLENSSTRKQVIEKGLLQAQKFTWDKCFEETYEFYKEIYHKKSGHQ